MTATTAVAGKVTAADLLGRLTRHYVPPGQAFPGGILAHEVTPLVPVPEMHGRVRRADALFVGFTNANRGLHGFEIKVSRGDWQTELQDPTKSSAWADACHSWWIVAPDTTVVRPEELPHGWGLLTIGRARNRLTVTVPAAVRDDYEPPWWATISVMARWDTLRGQAMESAGRARRAAEREAQYARQDVEQKVAAEVERRLQTGHGTSKAAELLAEIEGALGYRIVPRAAYRADEIDVDDIRRFAMVLAGERDLHKVTSGLVRKGWLNLREIRDALGRMEDALRRLDEIAADPDIRTPLTRQDAAVPALAEGAPVTEP